MEPFEYDKNENYTKLVKRLAKFLGFRILRYSKSDRRHSWIKKHEYIRIVFKSEDMTWCRRDRETSKVDWNRVHDASGTDRNMMYYDLLMKIMSFDDGAKGEEICIWKDGGWKPLLNVKFGSIEELKIYLDLNGA